MKCTVKTGTKTAGLVLHKWLYREMKRHGVRLFPGTLNLEPQCEFAFPKHKIAIQLDELIMKYCKTKPVESLDPGFYPARINRRRCWAFAWGPQHNGQLEIVADEYLREALNIEDGDTVDVCFE